MEGQSTPSSVLVNGHPVRVPMIMSSDTTKKSHWDLRPEQIPLNAMLLRHRTSATAQVVTAF